MAAINVPPRYQDHWKRPWTRKAKYSPGFRLWLHRHNRLSPHFTYAEAACSDGTPIPRRHRSKARNHAFNLERFRHEIGDAPIGPISWYRTPRLNLAIKGAKNSQHMRAVATDFDKATVDRVGRNRWNNAADVVFRTGGVGDYPGGASHLDSRGWRARWSSF